MQHATRRAAWEARNAAAVLRLQREPYSSTLAAAAIAARMELRRRMTPAAVEALLASAAA